MTSRFWLPALAASLAVGAPLASAQAPDQDPGGRSEVTRAQPAVDDRDPGGVSEAAAPRPDVGSDRDADAEPSLRVAPPAPWAPTLDAGRQGAVALRVSVEPYTGPLLDGRDAGAVPGAPRAVVPYDGPLDNGRGAGAEPVAAAGDPLAPEAAVAKADEASTELAMSGIRPNPAPGRAALSFTVASAVQTTVTVYDLTGRRVAVAYDGVPAQGVEQRVDLDLSGVAAGTYVVVLSTPQDRTSQTFQVIR